MIRRFSDAIGIWVTNSPWFMGILALFGAWMLSTTNNHNGWWWLLFAVNLLIALSFWQRAEQRWGRHGR